MKTLNPNLAFSAVAVTLFCSSLQFTCRAEGSTQDDGIVFADPNAANAQFGANRGVNRVIRTQGDPVQGVQGGYIGVRGELSISFEMPGEENGTYSSTSNVYNDKPSLYLGGTFVDAIRGQGTVEVDSGVQFEPYVVTNPTTGVTPAGWAVFHYVGGIRASPYIYDPALPAGQARAWRSFGNSLMQREICFEATPDGKARLIFPALNVPNTNNEIWAVDPGNANNPAINRVPTANHPLAPWADAQYPATVVFVTVRYNQSNVKRVIAMTRSSGGTSQLDGSQLTGTWSNCRILPFSANSTYRDWTASQVNQDRTGFDAPRLGNLSVDKRYNSRFVPSISKDIIEFLVPDANGLPTPVPSMRLRNPLTDNGRYLTETVRINLGTLTRPLGEVMQ